MTNYKEQSGVNLVRVHSETILGKNGHKDKEFNPNVAFPQLVTKHSAKNPHHRQYSTEVGNPVKEEQPGSEQKQKVLLSSPRNPKFKHYKAPNDKAEFNQPLTRRHRCSSVGELKLVPEEKKEPMTMKEISKMEQFIDQNEFNGVKLPDREIIKTDEAHEITTVKYHEDIEVINQTEEPKEVEVKPNSALENQIEHIVADQVDKMEKSKREEQPQQIVPIQEQNEEDGAIEALEKAKDNLQKEKDSIMKIVRAQPITAETKALNTQNLKPYAEPIKEEQLESP